MMLVPATMIDDGDGHLSLEMMTIVIVRECVLQSTRSTVVSCFHVFALLCSPLRCCHHIERNQASYNNHRATFKHSEELYLSPLQPPEAEPVVKNPEQTKVGRTKVEQKLEDPPDRFLRANVRAGTRTRRSEVPGRYTATVTRWTPKKARRMHY